MHAKNGPRRPSRSTIGDPHFSHPLEVAAILTDLKLDDATIVTALLHDVIEDTPITRAEIDQLFGPEIGRLVKAIEDLGKRLEPEFWAASLKADTDSLARLKEGGMEVANIPPAMMKDFRAKTEPLLGEFLKKVPAAEAPVKAYLAEMKR